MEKNLINELNASGEAALYRAMRHFWHPVMYTSELDDKPKRAILLDEQLVIVRMGGQVRAFKDLCIHRGTAMSLGWVEDNELRCPYHGWAYGADGVCTKIPARFGASIPTKARLQPYLVEEKFGLIWVCLEDEPQHPIPEFPEASDPDYQIVPIPPYEWHCSMHRRLENFVDFAHFSWVHDGVLGDRNKPEVPEHDVWREGAELRTKVVLPEATNNLRNQDLAGGETHLYTEKNYRIYIPGGVWVQHCMTPKDHYTLFMVTSPIGPKKTRSFTFLARDSDLDTSDQEYLDFEGVVLGQDEPIVASQRPEELPVDLSTELHIKGADRLSLEYRRWLIEIANSLGLENIHDR